MLIYSKYTPFFRYFKKTLQFGFTLTEFIVVITIATVLMTVLVIRQGSWNDRLSVTTQTYELALMIRQAQIYSLGVREDSGSTGDKFNIGYGVSFDTDNLQYIFFADRNNNQKYDSGNEMLETKTFSRGVTISNVCGQQHCFFSGGGPLRKAAITFFRPDVKANIALLNNGGNSVDNPPVTITLRSVGGQTASVKVEANGQISIQ